MDPKDLADPRNRRPAVSPEERSINAKRQSPARRGSDGSAEEDAYRVDPQEEPAHAPDDLHTGAIADRARGERALFDREDADADEAASRDESDESLTRDEAVPGDEVEIRHKRQ